MAEINDELSTGRVVYVVTKYGEPTVQKLKELGAKWDAGVKAWKIGASKRKAVEALLEQAKNEPEAEPKQEGPDSVRLFGRAKYKGRSYYMGATSRNGLRVRLLGLPDGEGKYLDFWADASLVEVTKTYEPREYRGRVEHMTLGGMRRFLDRQADPETARGQCTECGEWGTRGEQCRECYEGFFA